MALLERGFRIEGIHLRGPAVHEEMHDPLCFRREMRYTIRVRGCRAGLIHQSTQCHRTESHAAAAEEIAAVEHNVIGSGAMVHQGSVDELEFVG